jgi:hypothetical protein
MTRVIAPETAYTRDRLADLAEIEPRLAGVLDALSELAARYGSTAEIAAVERLAELVVHTAYTVEEFIIQAGAAVETLERRRHEAVECVRPGAEAVRTLVREVFAVEQVSLVLARAGAPGHPLLLLDEDRRQQVRVLGDAVERAVAAYTDSLRGVVRVLASTGAEPGPLVHLPTRAEPA